MSATTENGFSGPQNGHVMEIPDPHSLVELSVRSPDGRWVEKVSLTASATFADAMTHVCNLWRLPAAKHALVPAEEAGSEVAGTFRPGLVVGLTPRRSFQLVESSQLSAPSNFKAAREKKGKPAKVEVRGPGLIEIPCAELEGVLVGI